MKAFLPLAFLIAFSGCTGEPEQPVVQKDTLSKKDTVSFPHQPANPLSPVDVSPMDISYFPEDYPVSKMSGNTKDLPLARIIYSRPHRQGRKIFGELLKYGEPWRLGANEATEIELFRDATIQGKKINKGRYVLYCIPEQGNWTIVFNTNIYSWGLRNDGTKDIYRIKIPIQHLPQSFEYCTIVFQGSGKRADLVMAWDDVMARLPIVFE
jgi:hypothetical protein